MFIPNHGERAPFQTTSGNDFIRLFSLFMALC